NPNRVWWHRSPDLCFSGNLADTGQETCATGQARRPIPLQTCATPETLQSNGMSELVLTSRDGGIGIITINNPPVNALSPGVPEGIVAGLESVQKDSSLQGIVLIGGGRTFIAGADIKEFEKMTSGQKKRDVGLQPMLFALEDCAKPVVCPIHGT